MSVKTKRIWCGIRGHKLDKQYDEERKPYWVCRRCGQVKVRSDLAGGAAIGGGF